MRFDPFGFKAQEESLIRSMNEDFKRKRKIGHERIAKGRFFRDTEFRLFDGIPYDVLFEALRNLEERIAALEEPE